MPNRLALACILCGGFLSLAACDRAPLVLNDLEEARAAMQQRDWLQAERLLERYLRAEEIPAQRWEAWARLLEIRDRINPDPKAELLYLETMLAEFSHDEAKLKTILLRLGALRESFGQTGQALAVWTRLVELADLTDREAADIQRKIGNLYFSQRRFVGGGIRPCMVPL